MAFQSRVTNESFIASTDMRSLQYHAADLNATEFKAIVAAVEGGIGILQNQPKAGEHATVAIKGAVKARAGLAVTVGDKVSAATSGWVVPHTQGHVTSDTAALRDKTILGRALTTAASGSVFTMELDIQTTLVLST